MLAVLPVARAQADSSTSQCPHHAESSDNKSSSDMEHRGNQGMGFDQAKTRHHFLLTTTGGIIAVDAKSGEDSESRNQIRMHLAHIAKSFAEGDFEIPMFVHARTPPGVPVMKARKDKISYQFKETENGGQVALTTDDREALSAIHDFLVFQIREHKTGDKTALP
jgi:hypothetical protein